MGERRKARECALQVLYAMDASKVTAEEALKLYWQSHPEDSLEIRTFAADIVKGTSKKVEEIDNLITQYSTNWKISRMSMVDRNILRFSVYELMWCQTIPVKVTLNEAIEIAKQYGTEESGSFINGILDKVAKVSGKE
jgi:N utilization substance protein B